MDKVFNHLFAVARWRTRCCPKGFDVSPSIWIILSDTADQFGLIYYLAKHLGSLYLTFLF
jgi:hypothetical protein